MALEKEIYIRVGADIAFLESATDISCVLEKFRREGLCEDYLGQLEGGWLSEKGIDDENSDDEYREEDELRIIITVIVF
ncbi:hypothetical protein TNCV_5060411 [Trichonephila clavipes]|nr:hypothetical protein TNCV_5060411 [Trichonephila clavipes]